MNKLEQVRYAAAYTALAQKLDKHIKEFDSDPNTQTRWIWELIQNAKDAPNRFKQTKIKQSLDDTYFTSSHNGDAFEIPQLHSIVAQYSTKKEKNSQATKTTGKYGTGFITTYILSKIIEVSAILKVEIQEDSDAENQNSENKVSKSKQQNLKGGQQKQNLESLQNSFKKLSTQDDDIKDFQKRTHLNFKEKKLGKEHKGKSMFYYQKFSIPMDRSYIDRDEQLPKKIQKTQKRLTKIVVQAEYESTHNPDFSVRDYEQVERTVDSFDTEFKYKITDKRKFQMIQNTLASTKKLLPYAFLFNDNLTYYEFIDKRKFKEQDYSFSITKGELANIGTDIFLFTYQIQENYDHKTQKFLTNKIRYFVSYFVNNKAIAAVPVHIDETGIQILRVDEKLPKYFKDFPLIGCSDLKWNAVINSRQFYPNQKRSELMLNYYDQTNKQKVEMNWTHLYNCFGAIKEIYLFLSHHCKSGLENLLIFNSENSVANARLEFKAYLIELIKEICLTKLIPNRIHEEEAGSKATDLKNLVFIEVASDQKQIYNKNKKSHLDLSIRANEAFSFLYGKEFTISSDHYKAFYEILNYSSQYRKYLEFCQVITFVTINKSLQKMQQMNFSKFCVALKGNWQQKLHQIYSLLRDYNEQVYLKMSVKEKTVDYKIFLNQNNQFKALRFDSLKFNTLPKVYQQLAKLLGIDIKSNLIHEEFRKYIRQANQKYNFDILKMEQKIVNHFDWHKVRLDQKLKQIYNLQKFNLLFSLLMTFKCLDAQTVGLVKRFTEFEKIQQFAFNENRNDLHKLRKQITDKLLALFTSGFTTYYKNIAKQQTELKNLLSTKINIRYFDEAVDFLKDLFQDQLLGNSLLKVPIKLAWNGVFVDEKTLQKLNQKVQYPQQEDIQIYNLGYLQTVYFNNYDIDKLQERLVHPLYDRSKLSQIKSISYQQLYKPLKSKWNKFNFTQSHKILTYIAQINRLYHYGTTVDNTIKEKYQAWKNEIQKRLQKLFNLKLQNKELQQEPIKEFLYRLMDNKQELSHAQLIYQNNGNSLYFTTLCQQLNLVQNVQKKEEPKPNAKI